MNTIEKIGAIICIFLCGFIAAGGFFNIIFNEDEDDSAHEILVGLTIMATIMEFFFLFMLAFM